MGRISRCERSAIEAASPHRRALPAWLMSFGVHAIGFVAVALLFESPSQRPRIDRSHRRGEIVLVPARVNVESAVAATSPVEPEDEGAGSAEAAATLAKSEPASLTGQGMALPSSASPPAIAGMQLPEFDGVHAAGTGHVASIGSLGSRGRPVVLPTVHQEAILAEEAARLKEPLPSGTPARLSVFGAAATGRSFVFVIDRSESMGSSRLGAIEAAARELSASIDSLSADQYFQVVAYNQAASVYARRELMPASDGNKRELLDFVRKITSSGGTEHNFGLQAALRLRPEVIYLLSDGGDPIPNALQLRTVRDRAAGRTQIHCIHFGRGDQPISGADFLRKIAAENGGQYVYIDVNRR